MLDGCEIKKRLPHRFPFLFLDKVLELEENRALAQKNVTANEPYFRGHFPAAPVMPGVLVLECMIQLAWIMHSEQGGVRLERVRRLKFRRPVTPGDRLLVELNRVGEEDGLIRLRGVARLEEKVAVEGDLWVRHRNLTPGRRFDAR